MNLALKYRPKTFNDMVAQEEIIDILTYQVNNKSTKNSYLFVGASGCGKTTAARILADMLNNGKGSPIEIDAASNNGVDNIRSIIEQANFRSIISEYKIFIIDECVTGDTEILTNDGWKRIDKLTKNEKVAQYNNGLIEFVYPNEYIEKNYKGDMYNIKIGDKAIFTMSPNHVQPLLYNKSKMIKEKYIKDIKFNQNNSFIRSSVGIDRGEHLSNLERVVIALQADGSLQVEQKDYNYWTIQVKKERKKERLANILKLSGLKYNVLKSRGEECNRYSIWTPKNVTKKLSSYFNIENIDRTKAQEILEEMVLWDGYSNYENYLYYSCIDKDNVDFYQSVGMLCGYKSRISTREDNRSLSFSTSYRLYLQKDLGGYSNGRVEKEVIQYNGKIYCVKVPSNNIIIRKNGYVIVTGNCHMLSNGAWNALLKLLEEPPMKTVFILCTTEPQKVIPTVLSRVQRFDFTKIPDIKIIERLKYIYEKEVSNAQYDNKSFEIIAKNSQGGLRTAISLLDKCLDFSPNLIVNNVYMALNLISEDNLSNVVDYIFNKKEEELLKELDVLYNNSYDFKVFIKDLIKFSLEKYKENIINENRVKYLGLINCLLNINNEIKYDNDPKTIVECELLLFIKNI